MQTLETVTVMALLMIVGALVYKLKIVSDEGTKTLSAIVIYVSNPATVFLAFQLPYSEERLSGLGFSAIAAVVTNVLGIIVAKLLIRTKDSEKRVIERASVIYTNCGFLGIPLVLGVFGDEGVFYLATYVAINAIIIFTYGVASMTGKMNILGTLRLCLSPTIIAITLGVAAFLLRFSLPAVVYDAARQAANLTTPLAMLVAGATMAQSDFRLLLKKVRIYWVTAIKLLILPAVVYGVYRLLPFPELILSVNLVATAMPAATMVMVLALRYERDNVYAAEIFAVTTIVSMITLPLIIALPI